jgi:hypothetical protein
MHNSTRFARAAGDFSAHLGMDIPHSAYARYNLGEVFRL